MKNKKTSIQQQQQSKNESNISQRKFLNTVDHIPNETFYDQVCIDDNQITKVNQDKPFISQLKEKITHFIGHSNEAPTFTIDSEYILTGYRINFSTSKKVLKR